MDSGYDLIFWVKFIVLFIVFVILPVWVFNFVDISLLWKVGFTLAGVVGLYLALVGKSIGKSHSAGGF